MNESPSKSTSRREFLKSTGRLAAASALAGVALPHVHAAEDNTLRVALIGCGGRGTGAAANALSIHPNLGPIKLVAMADVFRDRLDGSYNALSRNAVSSRVDVPEDRKFIGFDAYKKAMDCLQPGDVAIFTTPLAFRWVHFTYAIEKGINVFMEKPLTADGATSRKMLKLADEASAKNLKVGVGLMSRHSRALQELARRVHDGEIGDIVLMRGYRMAGGAVGSAFSTRWPGPTAKTPTELLWQIRRFHSFIWASGGCFNDFYIHIIDHSCWMKNTWPVKAQALGGRHYKTTPEGVPYVDQNFDSYSVEYTFEDGTKLLMDGRCMSGAYDEYASYLHGTKGFGIGSAHNDCGLPSATYRGLSADPSKLIWRSIVAPDERDPYTNEWNDLVYAIRHDQPYNEVKRSVMATATSSLGRFAAHTGQEVTLEDFLNLDRVYAPDVDKFTMDSPPPLLADAEGRYPIPEPGIKRHAEF